MVTFALKYTLVETIILTATDDGVTVWRALSIKYFFYLKETRRVFSYFMVVYCITIMINSEYHGTITVLLTTVLFKLYNTSGCVTTKL